MLPTLKECNEIVSNSRLFEKSKFTIDGYTIYNFNYGVVKEETIPNSTLIKRSCMYNHFLNPIPEKPHVNAFELRGLSFVEQDDGTFKRYLMLNKFFNIDELESYILNYETGETFDIVKIEEYKLENLMNKKIKSITKKMDGSLVRFVKLPNGHIIAKTRGSFTSPQAKLALEYLNENTNLYNFVEWSLDNNLCTNYELCSPDFPIVLRYDTTKLLFLNAREEDSGKYIYL